VSSPEQQQQLQQQRQQQHEHELPAWLMSFDVQQCCFTKPGRMFAWCAGLFEWSMKYQQDGTRGSDVKEMPADKKAW
jgi:hypothetical protein